MNRASAALVAYAGLAGAAGVALAAAAAHGSDLSGLQTPAYLLTLHAGAAIAVLGLVAHAAYPRAFLLSAFVLLLGVTLFSGDIAMRTLAGARLFPMAAPTGGTTMIVGWLIAALAGALELFGRRS
jgi:uncharacterized membrane protein YgdD (TMEM256/DUF423 family)